MTRDECVNLILRRLTRRSGDSDLVADVILEMKLAQTTTFEKGPIKPWFLLTVGNLTVDGTGYKATLPANYLHVYEEEGALWLSESSGNTPLERVGPVEVNTPYKPLGTSMWHIDGTYVQLASQLDAASTLTMLYYKTDDVLDDAYESADGALTNLWLTHAADLIVAEVCYVIAALTLKYDAPRLALFSERKVAALKRLQSDTISREEAARVRLMNGGPFPIVGPVRA